MHPRNCAELWVIALELCSQATKVMTIVRALSSADGNESLIDTIADNCDSKECKNEKEKKKKKKNGKNLTEIDSSSSLSIRAPPQLVHSAKLATLVVLELLLFSLTHSQGRGLSDDEVRNALGKHIISATMGLCSSIFNFESDKRTRQRSSRLQPTYRES